MEYKFDITRGTDTLDYTNGGWVILKIAPAIPPTSTTTLTLFSSTTSIPVTHAATMAGSVTYSQFVQSIIGCPLVVEKIGIYSLASNYNQVQQNINYNLLEPDGRSNTYISFPTISQFQNQSAIVDIDANQFVLNGLNNISYTVLENQTVVLLFKIKNLDYEDYISMAKNITDKVVTNNNC